MPAQSYYKYQQGLPTVAGGANTGIMGAMQHPDQFAHANWLAGHLQAMGMKRAGNPFVTNGGFQSREEGGGFEGSQIHGYSGGGIPTNLFSQLTGRGPTAADVEQANGGGLAPPHNQMGTLPPPGILGGTPIADPTGVDVSGDQQWVKDARAHPFTPRAPFPTGPAWNPNTDLPDIAQPKAPATVGSPSPFPSGPEWNPNANMTIGENGSSNPYGQYLPTMHLLNGDIRSFLKHYLHS